MQGDPRIKLLDHLSNHLQAISADPSLQLDLPLLEQCQAALSPELPHSLFVRLQSEAIAAFRALQECPVPLSDLAVKAASFVTFADVQTFLQIDDIIQGLLAPLDSVSFLALIYLSKAADSPGDTATLGSQPGLVEALVELWLTTSKTYISEKALTVIISLLATDLPWETTYINKPSEGRVGNATGQGLVWRRMFRDKQVYELLFGLCSPRPRQGRVASRIDVSNAQGRLFDFLPRAAALNWDAVATSQMIEVEGIYDCYSLLDFASNHMIDVEDFLMKVTRFDFFEVLIRLRSIPTEACSALSKIPTASSPALEYLIHSGVHREILDFYINPEGVDPITLSLMSNVHHRYIATYLSMYPKHFLRDTSMIHSILQTLQKNLDVRPTAWAHGSPPYADLLILQALPGPALIQAEERGANPLHLIPTSPANAAAFHALGSIFNGRSARMAEASLEHNNHEKEDEAEAEQQTERDVAASARLLFLLYLHKHPDFWSNVGATTNILAMEDAAVAAVGLLRQIATAKWSTSTTSRASIREGPAVAQVNSVYASVKTGFGALISLGLSGFQALLTPPQPIAGAAGSDSSSAAWRIAREKWETIEVMRRLMDSGVGKDEVTGEHWEGLKSTLEARIASGPWGRASGAGSRVQTMEE